MSRCATAPLLSTTSLPFPNPKLFVPDQNAFIQMPSKPCAHSTDINEKYYLDVSAQAQRKCSNQTMAVARDVLVDGGIVFRVIEER